MIKDIYNPKILEALQSRRFIKVTNSPNNLHDIWIYRGRDQDYLLIRGLYCSCNDFLIRVIGKKTKKECYHLEGLEHAINSNSFIDLSSNSLLKSNLNNVVMEVLLEGYSPTLRKIITTSGEMLGTKKEEETYNTKSEKNHT